MFKFNNTHIFTGYLKQLLSTFHLPTCKIYTKDFASYFAAHGTEDPRIIQSFDTLDSARLAVRINYLKNGEVCNYFCTPTVNNNRYSFKSCEWKRSAKLYYDGSKSIPGLTKTLVSNGAAYDCVTHEYLGDYLRFLRDYNDLNLLSLYNCFSNHICNNLNYKINGSVFDSQDSAYKIYSLPVKLFAEYTIAIDCPTNLELFCGFYHTYLDRSERGINLSDVTYQRVTNTSFKQPFIYDKLSLANWTTEIVSTIDENKKAALFDESKVTRWDIACREQDLRLFIKVPSTCKSSIVILEGDYRNYNDNLYGIIEDKPRYIQNHSIVSINRSSSFNSYSFKPISKLQLLALNTGESYPFADRLIEYLSNSAITPLDRVPDNIMRVQKVMNTNKHFFEIEGVWEEPMREIAYDYVMAAGPIEQVLIGKDRADPDNYNKEVSKDYKGQVASMLVDRRTGYHKALSKSRLYDILGYIDRDTEKLYTGWVKTANGPKAEESILSANIYDDLYDF